VITHHIEQFKSFSSIENYWTTSPFIGIIGKLGVVLFFVLSGFLITYILLAEENSFKTISVRKFYIRRMIRILPLYILIILLAFGILPNIGLFTLPGFGKEVIYSNLFIKLFLYVILFPNLVLSLTGIVPYASHTWAIGTMEQYYLFLPVILKYFKKYRIGLMLLIILFYLFFVKLLSTHYAAYIPFKIEIAAFWSRFNIDCIAIGGIFALLLFQKSPAIKFLLNNVLFYSTLVLMIFLIVT
jgi:peptidoglycan/LPS O-acetylase OafA/YrhL